MQIEYDFICEKWIKKVKISLKCKSVKFVRVFVNNNVQFERNLTNKKWRNWVKSEILKC